MLSASDDRLVARFRGGDDTAFAKIVARYEPKLLRYAARMLGRRQPDAAHDVVQDVFLRAYRKLGADDRPMHLEAWLYRITRNRCLDELSRKVPAPLDEHAGLASAPSTAVEAEAAERLREVVGDILALPPRRRTALVSRELAGLSYPEIASALDATVPAAKALVHRARTSLAEAAALRYAATATGGGVAPSPRVPRATTRPVS